MSIQSPLPGMESFVDNEPKLPPIVLLYMAHIILREDVKTIFDHEILALRSMAELNDAQCPAELYVQQRKLCMALKEVVILLDEMKDTTEEIGGNNA